MITFAVVNRIMQAFVWLKRIRHCRGFGIQSPTDYSFVRDVVNEQRPYYAYSEVGLTDDWLRSKLGRLYLRLANYVQPNVIADLAGYSDYLSAGCRKAALAKSLSNDFGSVPALVVVPDGDVSPALLSHCGDKTMLVVEDISKHRRKCNGRQRPLPSTSTTAASPLSTHSEPSNTTLSTSKTTLHLLPL